MLLHILLFDRSYNLTYWVNYSELRGRLRRRYLEVEVPRVDVHQGGGEALLAWRLATQDVEKLRGLSVQEFGPQVEAGVLDI